MVTFATLDASRCWSAASMTSRVLGSFRKRTDDCHLAIIEIIETLGRRRLIVIAALTRATARVCRGDGVRNRCRGAGNGDTRNTPAMGSASSVDVSERIAITQICASESPTTWCQLTSFGDQRLSRRTRFHRCLAVLLDPRSTALARILGWTATISSRDGQYGDVRGGGDRTRCPVPEGSCRPGSGILHDAFGPN